MTLNLRQRGVKPRKVPRPTRVVALRGTHRDVDSWPLDLSHVGLRDVNVVYDRILDPF